MTNTEIEQLHNMNAEFDGIFASLIAFLDRREYQDYAGNELVQARCAFLRRKVHEFEQSVREGNQVR